MRHFLLSFLLLCGSHLHLYSQRIGFEPIDQAKVGNWLVDRTGEYEGVYHFGESESESELILIVNPEGITAQIRAGHWNKDVTAWIQEFHNLTNVRINGPLFLSDQTNGSFVTYEKAGQLFYGLLLNNPWSGGEPGVSEIGIRIQDLAHYHNGRFPEASRRPLKKIDLMTKSPEELRIMRNEIFARYGYIFRPGGEMNRYFRQQNWYLPQHEDVSAFLTDLEKDNITRILAMER